MTQAHVLNQNLGIASIRDSDKRLPVTTHLIRQPPAEAALAKDCKCRCLLEYVHKHIIRRIVFRYTMITAIMFAILSVVDIFERPVYCNLNVC